VSAFGATRGGDARSQNGQNGTVFTQQQTFIGWAPMEYNAPVMLALSEVEGTAQSEPVQLASLGAIPIGLRPDAGAVSIPDFIALVAKMQAEMPQAERPQRRVFYPSELNTQNSELRTKN
jgi:hypothetical protein